MMLGARTAAWEKAGGGVPTARDYVQEGLTFNLDCRENLGYGQFSDSATIWKNLVGEDFATFSSTSPLTWDFHDGCIFYGMTNSATIDLPETAFTPNLRTVEFCYKSIHHTMYARLFGSDSMSQGSYGTNYGLINNAAANDVSGNFHIRMGINASAQIGSSLLLPQAGVKCSCAFAFSSTSNFAFYVDAEKSTTKIYDGGFGVPYDSAVVRIPQYQKTRSADLVIYSLRIYNRMITDAERAANYAIDKARFNLPDWT